MDRYIRRAIIANAVALLTACRREHPLRLVTEAVRDADQVLPVSDRRIYYVQSDRRNGKHEILPRFHLAFRPKRRPPAGFAERVLLLHIHSFKNGRGATKIGG